MGYTVGATTSSVNVTGISVNSTTNKKYTLNEKRQNASMHYEEIDYSSIPNETTYTVKEKDETIEERVLYKLLGIDEEAAKRMSDRISDKKYFINEINNKFDEYLEICKNGFKPNTADELLAKAEQGNFVAKIIAFLTNAEAWNQDIATVQLPNGGTITMDGDKLIAKETNGIVYIYEDGLCTSIKYENGIMAHISYAPNGEAYDINYTAKNGKPISLFGDYNTINSQYGGRQNDFSDNSADLLQDSIVQQILEESFPNCTIEDYQTLLEKICNVGCGYTAFANSIFKQFTGKEGEFEEIFGFPMYTVDEKGNVDFNYEYLILESVLYANKNLGTVTPNGLDQSIKGVTEALNGWDAYANTKERLIEYLETKSIDVKTIEYTIGDDEFCKAWGEGSYNNKDINKLLKEILADPSKQVILGVGVLGVNDKYDDDYWKLIPIGEYENETEYNVEKFSATSGHAMYLIGFTEDGNYIVSSWGKQYILVLSDIGILTEVTILDFGE